MAFTGKLNYTQTDGNISALPAGSDISFVRTVTTFTFENYGRGGTPTAPTLTGTSFGVTVRDGSTVRNFNVHPGMRIEYTGLFIKAINARENGAGGASNWEITSAR